jgi:hypothetical protein
MCCCDDMTPSVYEESRPKARKPYKCCDCGRTIEVGELYLKVKGCWDGDWIGSRHCQHCEATADLYKSLDDEACISIGGLDDYLWQYHRDIVWKARRDWKAGKISSWTAMLRPFVSLRRDWRFKRGQRKGQLMPVPVVPVAATA